MIGRSVKASSLLSARATRSMRHHARLLFSSCKQTRYVAKEYSKQNGGPVQRSVRSKVRLFLARET